MHKHIVFTITDTFDQIDYGIDLVDKEAGDIADFLESVSELNDQIYQVSSAVFLDDSTDFIGLQKNRDVLWGHVPLVSLEALPV